MNYEDIAIKDDEVPLASSRVFQHVVKTYASEVNKLNSVWHEFTEEDLAFKPQERASTVGQIIEHELLRASSSTARRVFAHVGSERPINLRPNRRRTLGRIRSDN